MDKELYRRFHDVIIPSNNGTTQVDHILVSPFGLFIVETKNLKGWIYGSESGSTWTQVVYGSKYSFQNPLRQTHRHKKVLSKYLDIKESHIQTIVCFVGDSKFKKNIRHKGNNSRQHHSLLSDLLVCYCDENITGNIKKTVNRKSYGCRSKFSKWKGKEVNPCMNNRSMNMDQTDQLIVDRIKGVVGNSSLIKEKFKKEILNKKSIDSKQISQDKKNLETTIKGLDQQLETNLKSISQVEVNHMLKKIENKRYKVISKLLEEELVTLEDKKKSLVQEIDDLDNQKEWVDWISKYGDDISKRFNKPTSELLEGIVDKIIVSPVIGETREGKDTQRGHIFNIKFKLPIVNDSIEYKDDQNK